MEFPDFTIFILHSLPLPAYNPHNTLSDEELLLTYRQSGDSRWMGLLLQRYTILLLGVAMKYLKDKDAAQDAVQHIFLKALVHLPHGEMLNFKGWLYILMRNYCLTQLRDKVYLAPDEALHIVPAADDPVVEELLLRDATLEQMKESLLDLEPDQQNCIRMFYLEKRSYQQIMEAEGFSFRQVKSFIQNGKRNLRLAIIRKMASKRP